MTRKVGRGTGPGVAVPDSDAEYEIYLQVIRGEVTMSETVPS
jgi:hypothetical protein